MSMVSPGDLFIRRARFSGIRFAMTAGIETLKILSGKGTYKKLEKLCAMLEEGLVDAAKKAGVKTRFYRSRRYVLHIFH